MYMLQHTEVKALGRWLVFGGGDGVFGLHPIWRQKPETYN
jgi:hypothetical protein